MKKLLILLIFSILFLSQSSKAKDYSYLCSQNNVSKTFLGNIMSLSGINSLTRNIIESEIQKAIYKETNSKFKIKINNFYGNNILNGEFKSLSAFSKSYQDGNLYMSDVEVNTICPYNHISYEENKIIFKENMVLKYSAKINQNDLDKIVNSGSYKKLLDKMNNDKVISSLVQIKNADVEIKNNKLIFRYKLLPLAKYSLSFISKKSISPIIISFSSDLEIKDGKVQICNFGLNSDSSNYSMFLPLVNKLNPTLYNIDLDKNNKGKIELDNVKIINNEILLEGYIIIEKSK